MGKRDSGGGGGAPLWSAMISARSGGAVRTVDRDDDWDENRKPMQSGPNPLQRLANWVCRTGA